MRRLAYVVFSHHVATFVFFWQVAMPPHAEIQRGNVRKFHVTSPPLPDFRAKLAAVLGLCGPMK